MPSSVVPTRLSAWVMLPGRTVLFLLFQALIALGFAAYGTSGAWDRSSAWWPLTVTLTNAVCLAVMLRQFRAEGRSYWDIFRFDRSRWKSDVLVMLAVLVITGPVAMLPGNLLAGALFGDPLAVLRLFLAPLPPLGLVFALVLFPITQGLVELAFYFLYIMPRLAKQINPWAAYALASLFLGFQHAMIPLRFDPRFFTWRLLMFVPFSFLIGGVLKWRPRLLVYAAPVHALMDFATAVMYLTGF